MIGGLQGEFEDLDIKYLKQNISKCRLQISGSFRRNPTTRGLRNFAAKGQYFHSPRLISQPCKICLQLGAPSFQLWIMHRLKHWIVDFLSFETTYSMHKLNYKKFSKSGLHYCHLECFMADFSLLPLLAFRICLWQRTLKLQSFGSSFFLSFPLLCHGFQRTLLNLGLLWWSIY